MSKLRAIEAFHAPDRFIDAGEEVASTDPVVKGREHLFSKVDEPTPRKATARKRTAKAED